MKWVVHNVPLPCHNGPKMLLIKSQSGVLAINSLLELPKHAIKGLIILSKVRSVSINISNHMNNMLNEGANVSTSANKLQVRKLY